MKNPWLKKNPLMSMWLSGANAVAGSVSGRVVAESRRQGKAAMNRAMKQAAGFWTGMPVAKPSTKRKKKRH
ncbi:hypothetical protein [Noviherbaspirillum denitrificans]|uniref:Uncharacterized protein n=1 Tax=Noviherbaspirillum denitrificans TaxID=1968433 RepID=A0A254TCY3_9BURK|nr:hypothetical protein [Noviherbaspirillum denitrificans]OWW20474.1 hypothetical protein AYR66_14235 [Noviherbaspirillum denitrificans]